MIEKKKGTIDMFVYGYNTQFKIMKNAITGVVGTSKGIISNFNGTREAITRNDL